MKSKLEAVHGYTVLKVLKEEEQAPTPGKLIVPTRKTSTKFYEVLDGGPYPNGTIVCITGYSNVVELDDEVFNIVKNDEILAVRR
jgi:hypothetical protein